MSVNNVGKKIGAALLASSALVSPSGSSKALSLTDRDGYVPPGREEAVGLPFGMVNVGTFKSAALVGESVALFRNQQYALAARAKELLLQSPLPSARIVTPNRFGTPYVMVRNEEPWGAIYTSLIHDGVDIKRSDPSASAVVGAPVAGYAAVIGGQLTGTPSDYNTAVVIYDPKSRLVTALLHVRPDASLSESVEPKWVKRGDPVGELAVPPGIPPLQVEEFRHVHVMVIDGSRREPRLLNPIRFLKGYVDEVSPKLLSLDLVGDNDQLSARLISGRRDLVVTVSDRDGDGTPSNRGSGVNLEPSKIGYELTAFAGKNVRFTKALRTCDLDPLFRTPDLNKVAQAVANLTDVVTAGNTQALPSVFNDGTRSDQDNPNRVFRYDLSNLRRAKSGACTVKADQDAYLSIPKEVDRIRVKVTLEDALGNRAQDSFELVR